MDPCLHQTRRAPSRSDQRVELAVAWPADPRPDGALLFCPQPFLGGDMDNNVVLALQATLTARGWPVVRFNYRGVGASEDVEPGRNRFEYWRDVEQRGDQAAVREDGREAHRRARGLFGVRLLAGYSFGAAVALAVAAERDPDAALVLVAPPFGHVDLEALATRRAPTLLVLAGRDALTPPPPVGELARRFPAVEVVVLDQADHFLLGCEQRLDQALAPFLAGLDASPAVPTPTSLEGATPDPVSPEPAAPAPVSSDPATPDPVSPAPVSPDPTAPPARSAP